MIEGENMIVIQSFPSTAALIGWLQNRRYSCNDHRAFVRWLQGYIAGGREITVRGRQYDYRECVMLMKSAGA